MKFVKFVSVLAAFGMLTFGAFAQEAAPGAAPAAPVATEKPAKAEKPAKTERPAPKPLDVSTLKAVTVKGTVKLIVIDPAKNPRLAKGLEFQLTGEATANVVAGPKEYIENKLGLKLTDGVTAEVAGWERKMAKGVIVMAKSITVDGKVYILRDDKGVPAWEPKKIIKFKELTKAELEKAEVVTVTGPAKLPEGLDAENMDFVRYAIDDKTIVLVAPKKIADDLGIVIKEGDTLKVVGWKVVREEKIFVLARDLTVNDKFVNLRDFDGKIIKPKPVKAGGDKPARAPKQEKPQKNKGEKV